jgi:hypothetical protein
VLIIPRGAIVHGTAVQSKKAGTLTGSPDLILKLVSLDLGGRSHPLYSYQFKVEGTSKTKPTETKVKGGALIGSLHQTSTIVHLDLPVDPKSSIVRKNLETVSYLLD